jgi:uncharacterized protein (TIGR00730 family)
MRIGITLTSSLSVGDQYIELTKQVAHKIAQSGDGIVYGGTDYGMMKTLAESYKEAGGTDLAGVMAKDLMAVTRGYVAYDQLDESYTEDSMELRKQKIMSLSDGFIILPGGYGTLEELTAIIGGNVNKLYSKPVAIYNYGGFYDSFIGFIDELVQKEFSKVGLRDIAFVSEDLNEIYNFLKNYQANDVADKFI